MTPRCHYHCEQRSDGTYETLLVVGRGADTQRASDEEARRGAQLLVTDNYRPDARMNAFRSRAHTRAPEPAISPQHQEAPKHRTRSRSHIRERPFDECVCDVHRERDEALSPSGRVTRYLPGRFNIYALMAILWSHWGLMHGMMGRPCMCASSHASAWYCDK